MEVQAGSEDPVDVTSANRPRSAGTTKPNYNASVQHIPSISMDDLFLYLSWRAPCFLLRAGHGFSNSVGFLVSEFLKTTKRVIKPLGETQFKKQEDCITNLLDITLHLKVPVEIH